MFWSIISERRKKNGFALQTLADALGIDKSAVSRWFSGTPNWTMNTVSDIANVLDVEINISGRDRRTGQIFTASGPVETGIGTIPSAPVRVINRFASPISSPQKDIVSLQVGRYVQ
jgi:transcriptional regulator with XRE-family HTH domain